MSPIVTVIVSTIVFVGALLAMSLVYWGVEARKEDQQRELARRLGSLSGDAEGTLFRAPTKDDLAKALGETGERLEGVIRQANVDYTVSGLVTRMALFGLIGAGIGMILARSLFGFAGILIGVVPYFLLLRQSNQRAARISQQLPEALDLMARSLRAGHGLNDSMRMCAEELPMPIAVEFARVYEEHNLGRDFREAMHNLLARNPRNFDLRIFVSSVLLQRDTGGNMIEILQNISKTIRDRFIFHGKVKSLTAEARFSAYILGGLPFVVIGAIIVINPEYLRPLVEDPLGHMFIGLVIFLFVTGVLVMRKVSQVEL